MNKSRICIELSVGGIFVLLFLIVSYLKNIDLEEDVLSKLVFTYEGEKWTVDFPVWKDETVGKYFLFLPSGVDDKQGEFTVHYNDYIAKLKIDDEFYSNGSSFFEDGSEVEHSLEIRGITGEGLLGTTLQVFHSENLPSIFIEIENQDRVLDVNRQADKRNFETGFMWLIDESGELMHQGRMEKFKVRGNLTAVLGKKPFTFTLKNPTELLGMESAVKWNLLANATDGTYIRNKIIRELANECIDTYEPQGELVEVYLNGAFQGLYLLTEAVEIAPNRIEIDPNKNWFIEMELEFRTREDPTRMVTDRGQCFIIHSEQIVTESEREALLERLNDVESALYAENSISEISGKPLEELIDLESFAKAWLVEELTGDHDTGIASQFAYISKEEGSLLFAGPTWDFDGIMGNVNKPMYAVPESLTGVVEMIGTPEDADQNRWLSAMWRYPKFQEIVKREYARVFRGKYEEILENEIDRQIFQIRRSAVLDAFRWHNNRLNWFFVLPEGVSDQIQDSYEKYDTLDESITVVKDFMSRKLDFLDKLWIEGREFCIVEVRNSASFLDQGYNQTLYYWVEQGTAIQNLPHYENEEWQFDGYYDKDYGELISDGFIIEYHRIIEGHWSLREEENHEGESDGN